MLSKELPSKDEACARAVFAIGARGKCARAHGLTGVLYIVAFRALPPWLSRCIAAHRDGTEKFALIAPDLFITGISGDARARARQAAPVIPILLRRKSGLMYNA